MSGEKTHKFGFVSVVGGANVGKSTLVNALVGSKVCAVSPKPNTTRSRIRGVLTAADAQIAFTDTPGIVRASGGMLKRMNAAALGAVEDGRTLVVTDAARPFGKGEERAIEGSSRPVIVALNKTDTVGEAEVFEAIGAAARFGEKVSDIVPVSALRERGLGRLLEVIKGALPAGERMLPGKPSGDGAEMFTAAEFVREKVFRLTRGEVPYGCAVAVREMSRRKNRTVVYIRAEVFVEKEGHRKIVIGKDGRMIKKIGSRARADMEKFLDANVFLDLKVVVKPGWSKDARFLEEVYGI